MHRSGRRLVTRLVVVAAPLLLLTLFATSMLMSDAEWMPSGGEGKLRVSRYAPSPLPPQITACFTFFSAPPIISFYKRISRRIRGMLSRVHARVNRQAKSVTLLFFSSAAASAAGAVRERAGRSVKAARAAQKTRPSARRATRQTTATTR